MKLERNAIHGWLRTLLLCAATLLSVAGVYADDDSVFRVVDPVASEVDGVYYLELRLDLTLGKEMRNALDNGVPLVFLVEIKLLAPRRWLPDEQVALLQQRYELSHHFLTQRYIVRNINTDSHLTYGDLGGALDAISRISQLPVIDSGLVNPDNTRATVRVLIDASALPMPLRLNAYADKVWRTSSDWVPWPLK